MTEKDENNDGKNDRMNLVLHVTNATSYDINGFHLILIYDYKLQVSQSGVVLWEKTDQLYYKFFSTGRMYTSHGGNGHDILYIFTASR